MQICNVHVAVVVVVAKLPTKTNQVGEINSNFTQIIPTHRRHCFAAYVKDVLRCVLDSKHDYFFASLFSGAVITFAVNVKLF